MPKFKHPTTGDVVEVTEEFANQVLRAQGKYKEIEFEVPEVVSKKKTSKKKSKRL